MYLFISQRLGFRPWRDEDLDKLHQLCSDPQVMEFFPSVLDRQGSQELLERLQKMYDEHRYTYFYVEMIETREFVGFIGLAYQTYDAPFTPGIDIGWRLLPEAWGKGYASEGARRCLSWAAEYELADHIFSVASLENRNSTRVMEAIGMKKFLDFVFPTIPVTDRLQPFVAYTIPVRR